MYNQNFKNNNSNNFHNNYQTYRIECSKLIPNDEYEPNPINDTNNSLNNNSDLRNFLIAKAIRQQIQTNSNNYNDDDDNENTKLEDLDYSEPITEPINIKNEFYKNPYYDNKRKYNRDSSYFYKNKNLYTEDSIIHNNVYYNNQINEQNIEKNDNLKSNNDLNGNQGDEDEDEDEDDDDDQSHKKLKSVVIPTNRARSNYTLFQL